MSPRTTLREVAERAGVHFTTVSRALRNHPGIPAETRERIRALADEMGYVPDPFVSALNAYRLTKRRVSFQGVIAWLTSYSPKGGSGHGHLYEGAERRAAELGYRLEHVQIGSSPRPDVGRVGRVLAARNIRGVVIAPQLNAHTRLELNWERHSALTVSHSLEFPSLHLVTNDQLLNMTTAMRRLSGLGYRRIGLLLERRLIEITGRRWLAGYLAEREQADPADRLEVLAFDEPAPASLLRKWFRANRPDAIITERAFWQKRLHGELGLRCPRDVGVALVSTREGEPFAGIVENVERVGAAAVEQVVRMEHSDERGVPAHPVRIFIEGEWRDGPSAVRA